VSDQPSPLVTRWNRDDERESAEFVALLTDYHRQTEAEKGAPVTSVADLSAKYSAEIDDPRRVFAAHQVFLAHDRGRVAGCLVVTEHPGDRLELKRLWTDPAHRGRRVATALLDAAHHHAVHVGAPGIRLSVWQWRADAIALYRKAGFVETASWEDREQLTCMIRDV